MLMNAKTWNYKKSEVDFVSSVFSVDIFLHFLDQYAKDESINHRLLELAKKKIISFFPNGDCKIDIENAEYFSEVFKLIYQLTVNPLENEKTYYWGISPLFVPKIIYGTQLLYDLLSSVDTSNELNFLHHPLQEELNEKDALKTLIYNYILEKLYGINVLSPPENIICLNIENKEQYYKLNLNTKYSEVSYKGIVPPISEMLTGKDFTNAKSILDVLQERLPLSQFTFSGFTIIEITEYTNKILKEKLKSFLLSQEMNDGIHQKITDVVKQLLGYQNMDILMLPIMHINDTLIVEIWDSFKTTLTSVLENYHVNEILFYEVIKNYANDPLRRFDHENMNSLMPDHKKGLMLQPVFSRGSLTGLIIIFAENKTIIPELMFSNLQDILPVLENMFDSVTKNYTGLLDREIKNQFTAIQPAVEWKFNNAGIQHLQKKAGNDINEFISVEFKDLYPLYGAIDFRNSTSARNKAAREDLEIQLESLRAALADITKIIKIPILEEMSHRSMDFCEMIAEAEISTAKEAEINHFLKEESLAVLTLLSQENQSIHNLAVDYLNAVEEGLMFQSNRKSLEETFKILNDLIHLYLDDMLKDIQNCFPCYFEKYRTDGVEFNLYIGQSIAPKKPFNMLYVKNARICQLKSMISVAQRMERIKSSLPKAVETTQLIFVHPETISISFREDEKRFDVEGSYNIRYEIIKKRIDKAFIKDRNERLTQPGKIAIVFYHQKDIEDYLQHIFFLQKQNLIDSEIEELELEPMQGVNGLRAIRLKILPENPN
ncbi:hypothetical protein IX38_22335 [Chryseobacterium luteum]|uniref:GAF domain-containing protein n=2 Tax=Chryseobacterium luteum TaxID=421531 RepID=A0A085YXQ4_9FLAO|nr:hypothetical protein IX38_22335 [Chryseobacterium luteum]